MADTSRTVEIIFQGNNQLGGAIAAVEAQLGGITGSASAAASSMESLAASTGALASANIGSTSTSLAAISGSAQTASGATLALSGSIGSVASSGPLLLGVDSNFRDMSESALNAAAGAGSAKDAVSQFGSSGASDRVASIAKSFAALASAAALLSAGRKFIEVNAQLETIDRTFTKITGSSSAAARELEFVNEVADRLGLEFVGTAESYGRFLAATKGTELEGEQTRQIFEKVAGAMANLGRSSADTQGVLTALEQIVSKNRVSAEELRQQLGERLSGAFRIAAESMGVTTEELDELLRSGKLVAEDFLPRFASEIDKTLGTSGRIETFNAEVARLKNAFTDLSTAVADAGVFAAITRGVKNTAEAVKEGAESFEDYVTKYQAFKKATESAGEDLRGALDPDFSEEDFQEINDAAEKGLFDGAWVSGAAKRFRENVKEIFASVEAGLGLNGFEFLEDIDFSIPEGFAEGLNAPTKDLALNLEEIEVTAKRITPNLEQFKSPIKGAAEEARRAALELEKLASNERIKNIEARVTLDVANINAESEQAVAAIENISTAITSTSDLIGELFDNRIDADSWEERRLIEEQIRKQSERQESQLKKNNKLVDEQIKKLRAQTDALRRGDSLITIDGSGLQPHLEAFMFEILEALQVRVNAEGGDLLLGTLS